MSVGSELIDRIRLELTGKEPIFGNEAVFLGMRPSSIDPDKNRRRILELRPTLVELLGD